MGFSMEQLMANLGNDHTILVAYLIVINILTFALFCIDKFKAKTHAWRVRESTLLGLSLIGGCIGGMIAMRVARHKIRKPKFKYGLPIMLLLDIAVIAYLIQRGIA